MSSDPIASSFSESFHFPSSPTSGATVDTLQEAKDLAMKIGVSKAKADCSFFDELARKITHFKPGKIQKSNSQIYFLYFF